MDRSLDTTYRPKATASSGDVVDAPRRRHVQPGVMVPRSVNDADLVSSTAGVRGRSSPLSSQTPGGRVVEPPWVSAVPAWPARHGRHVRRGGRRRSFSASEPSDGSAARAPQLQGRHSPLCAVATLRLAGAVRTRRAVRPRRPRGAGPGPVAEGRRRRAVRPGRAPSPGSSTRAPTANGRPGLHHVWARVFKDLYPRFQTMRGHAVPRKGGWDCHGLPVELEVEKELGLTRSSRSRTYGIAEFNQRCRDVRAPLRGGLVVADRARRASGSTPTTPTGRSSNDYIESVWWLVRQMWDQGLLYEGHRVSPYCPRCGTALSSHEMGQPGVYQDVTDPSVYVRFPRASDDDADLLVWTTTPWTLISNVAAAVGPDIAYVRVPEPDGRDLVLAEAAAERLLRRGRPTTWSRVAPAPTSSGGATSGPSTFLAHRRATRRAGRGRRLRDHRRRLGHRPPRPRLRRGGRRGRAGPRACPCSTRSTPTAPSTSAVAPWPGSVRQGRRPPPSSTTSATAACSCGRSPTCTATPTAGAAARRSSTGPRRRGSPAPRTAGTSCWRENERISWHPEHIKHGRFGKWLENNVDWALSRDRYWGTPLPIWRCDARRTTPASARWPSWPSWPGGT